MRTMPGGGSAPSCCAFTHRVAFEEGSGPRVLEALHSRAGKTYRVSWGESGQCRHEKAGATDSLMVEGCRERSQGARRTLTPPLGHREWVRGETEPRRLRLQSGWKAAGVLGKRPGGG